MAKAILLVVLEQIVIEVGQDKLYVIFVDECTDVTGNELIIVVIQYVNSLTSKILERIIGTAKVDIVTSNRLFDTVVHILSRANLDMKQCRAQGYDGAANMSGHKTGLAARVKN